MTLPRAPAPPAAAHAGAAPPGRRDPARASTTSSRRCSCARASTSRSRSPRCPASCSTPASRCARRCAELADLGVPGVILFGVPAHKDADGLRRVGSRRHRAARAARPARRGRRRRSCCMADLCLDEYTDHGHCGVLDRRRRRSTTTPPSSSTREVARRAGRGRRRHRRAERDDGRPGRRHPRRARRRRATTRRRSWPTRPSTPRRCTGRSATRSTCTIAGGGDRKGYQQDSRNAPRGARGDARSTSPRAPTW